MRATGDALFWQQGPLDFQTSSGDVDEAIGVIGLLTLAGAHISSSGHSPRRVCFPSGAPPSGSPLVRRHGDDTLAYFKLRRDQHYLFGGDERRSSATASRPACCSSPVTRSGPPGDPPRFCGSWALFAEASGLKLAALGDGEVLRPLWRQFGLRSLYLGDEAVVEIASFSLEGRAIRKVRQSVTRLEKRATTPSCAGSRSSPTRSWPTWMR